MKGQPPAIRIILTAYGEEHIAQLLPEGWKEHSASWEFDWENFGYQMKYGTTKFRFVKEDADFLRKQLDAYGVSAEVDFTAQRRLDNWTYKTYFTGQISFAGDYENSEHFVEVTVIEGGLKRALSKGSKNKYDVPFDGDPDAIDIEVPEGIQLYESVKYIKEGTGNVNENKVYERLVITNSFVVSRHLMFQNQYYESQVLYPFLVAKGKEADELPYTYPMKMYLDFAIKKTSNFTYNPVTFMITKVLHGNSANNYIAVAHYTITPAYLNDNDRILFSIDFNININDTNTYDYYLVWTYYYNPPSIWRVPVVFDGSIDISYFGSATTPIFNFKAIPAEKLVDKLIKNIHDTAECQIPLLENELPQGSKLFLTCGDAIRGLPEAQIKTSFTDFITALGCLFETALKTSNKANDDGGLCQIVNKSEIIDKNNELLDLGIVQNMKALKLPEDWLYNNIKVGYEKQEYDYPLGRQDFSCSLEYINSLKIPNKSLELISKYRADYTGVHLLHYNYVNSDKTDSKSDNDIFWILAFLKDGKWQAIKGDYVVVGSESLEGGGYFNILLSPHRNLRRHRNYLKSILDKHEKSLKYTSSTETQTDMFSVHYIGDLIDEVQEKTDENVSSGTVLFKPIIFEFDCITPRNLPELLGESPAGYFTFHYNNLTLKGFPIEVAGSHKSSKQTVKCVAHPDTQDNIQEMLFKRLPNRLY